VREQPLGAGDRGDHVARLGDLVVGEQPPFGVVERRTGEQREVGLAVQIDLLQEVVEPVALQAQTDVLKHLRVPVLGREIAEPEQTLLVEVVADEMALDVEDELARQILGARLCDLQLGGLGLAHLEHLPEHLIHGEE
jgi:hypothetical protein